MNTSLSGAPTLTGTTTDINFNWGLGTPTAGFPADFFSVRWVRNLPLEAGRYRFTTTTDDGVRLWVNNVERMASASISGGVTLNNSPVVIGADPQGATDRRYFFKGKIQQVMVQKWRNH